MTQKIEIKTDKGYTELYIDDEIQFDEKWEYRYHEALVHPGLSNIKDPERVLILGGGDGLAAREVLKYITIKNITIVDIDETVTDLFKNEPSLSKLNEFSLNNENVKVINEDAYEYVKNCKDQYDFVICDFPDPTLPELEKLYSKEFYSNLKKISKTWVTHANDPYTASNTFWCILNTVLASNYCATPYHTNIPSWGEWGFIVASTNPFKLAKNFLVAQKSLSEGIINAMMIFGPDFSRKDTKINSIESPCMVDYLKESEAYENN